MMQVVLHHFPGAQVEYKFRCRTPGVNLSAHLDESIERLGVTRLAGVAGRRGWGEPGQFGHRQYRRGLAESGHGRSPAGPQHDRHVVFGDPHAIGDGLRRRPRERIGVGRTITHSRQPNRRPVR